MNFKFFHGKQLNLADNVRFNNLVNHRSISNRYSYMYRSSIPRNQLSDELFNEMVEQGINRIRRDSGILYGNVQWDFIDAFEEGFGIRFQIFY